MLDPNNETIYAGNGTDGLSESFHDNVNYAGEFVEDNNLESNLRRRKGKIISCAKETIEHGEWNCVYAWCSTLKRKDFYRN